MKTSLVYCEDFYSVQGEGVSAGVPAVFLRLAGCNLDCLGFSYKDPETGEHLGCDSKAVWRRGKKIEFVDLLQRWRSNGWLSALQQGAHLVITGGEPVVQQTQLMAFIDALDAEAKCPVYIEIETNGTLLLDLPLCQRLNQINVSPKLSNSGESRAKARVPEVLSQLSASNKTHFKFVVSEPVNINEILEHYVEPYKIPTSRVWLMPEGGTREQLQAKQAWVVEQCKTHLFRFSPRLQVAIWDEVTGV